MYSLFWRSPALPFLQKNTAIAVPAGSIVSNAASLRFTGKGASNYGKVQQENLLRLLENFAGPTAPEYSTVGQVWYDTDVTTLKVMVRSAPEPDAWRSLNSTQITGIGEGPPSPASLGDTWFSRTGSASGIQYVYTGIGRYPQTGNEIGGWEQVFPTVERAAGREEYDYMLGLLKTLIGDTSESGGSGAFNRAIANLTDFDLLDASLVEKFNSLLPLDRNVLSSGANSSLLKVDPNSNDWDFLLSAAKYAINRLDVPLGYLTDVSPVPFVTDGRAPPSALKELDPINPQYPDALRLSSRKTGTIALGRYYQETVNVLRTAERVRYLLKGMQGASFSDTVEPTSVGAFTYSGQFTTPVTHGLLYRFDQASRARFFFAGGALTFAGTHAPGSAPTAADIDLKTILETHGRIRFTADRTFILDGANSPALAVQPINLGFNDLTLGSTVLAVFNVGAATIRFSANLVDGVESGIEDGVNLVIEITTTAGTTGVTTVECGYISDGELFNSPPVRVYPQPLALTATDRTGQFA